ncbi:hypothetical protein KY320_02705 [Candidatus Woesearchaeota archaeon]|nr:hypothetical protein [Candidatus Woesearchaeota archaeon]
MIHLEPFTVSSSDLHGLLEEIISSDDFRAYYGQDIEERSNGPRVTSSYERKLGLDKEPRIEYLIQGVEEIDNIPYPQQSSLFLCHEATDEWYALNLGGECQLVRLAPPTLADRKPWQQVTPKYHTDGNGSARFSGYFILAKIRTGELHLDSGRIFTRLPLGESTDQLFERILQLCTNYKTV